MSYLRAVNLWKAYVPLMAKAPTTTGNAKYTSRCSTGLSLIVSMATGIMPTVAPTKKASVGSKLLLAAGCSIGGSDSGLFNSGINQFYHAEATLS